MTQAQIFSQQPTNPQVQPKYSTARSGVELRVFEDGSGAISTSSSNISTLTAEQLGLLFGDMQSFMKTIAADPRLGPTVFPTGVPA
jgi:hypothetical protein